jgi:hypothetical protein
MRPQDLEPDMDALLARLAPDLADRWHGASDAEIERIEQLAIRPLPRFYRWFLSRMAGDLGRLAYPSVDFTARRVLKAYDEAEFDPHPRFLMIGYATSSDMPLHVFYDLEHPAGGDAHVGRAYDPTEELHVEFETFREMLAYGGVLTRRILVAPQRCKGVIESDDGDVIAHLAPKMYELGFSSPIPTGRFCAIHEADDTTLLTTADPTSEPRYHPFWLAGNDVGRMRRILGQIAVDTPLEVRVTDWTPPFR